MRLKRDTVSKRVAIVTDEHAKTDVAATSSPSPNPRVTQFVTQPVIVEPPVEPVVEPTVKRPAKSRGKLIALVLTAVAALLVGGLLYWRWHTSATLGEKDTIVLSDFSNTTGEAVFDDALKQGLAIQLEQSPFLSLVSDQRIGQALQMMGKPPDTRVTPAIAKELCARAGGTAEVEGAIASLGSQYVLSSNALNCSTGTVLGESKSLAVITRAREKLACPSARPPVHCAASWVNPQHGKQSIRR